MQDSAASDFESLLDSLWQSDRFRDWQQRLPDCFRDKERKNALIREAVIAQRSPVRRRSGSA